jgi:hypothetical protein
MQKLLLTLALCASSALAQYQVQPAGAPPAGVAGLSTKAATKVLDAAGKVWCEIWLLDTMPNGPKSTETDVTLPNVPHGSLLGVVRFPVRAADRRGQTIKPGDYTMRYSYYPQNGDHQGAAPQRDFLLLTPLAGDKELSSTPKFNDLVAMSRQASGTPHPCVLSFWKEDADFAPGFRQMGEHDWVWYVQAGELKLGIILVGQAEG